MRRALLVSLAAAAALWAAPAPAQSPAEAPRAVETLPAAEEARARALMREIACLVCEGQPIAESNAPVAREMRRRVRDDVAAGLNDAEIRARIAASYGEAALLRPGSSGGGLLLWIAPLIILSGALALAFVLLRGRAPQEGAGDKGVS